MGLSKKLHAKLSKGGLSDLPTVKMKGRADMPTGGLWRHLGQNNRV